MIHLWDIDELSMKQRWITDAEMANFRFSRTDFRTFLKDAAIMQNYAENASNDVYYQVTCTW